MMSKRIEIVSSFYDDVDEDSRLNKSRHGQLEYVTTINGWHGVRWKNRIVWVSGEFSKVSEA